MFKKINTPRKGLFQEICLFCPTYVVNVVLSEPVDSHFSQHICLFLQQLFNPNQRGIPAD